VVKNKLTCRHPDRDCPKIMCGHPLPCPWHTAEIDPYSNPPTIKIPITSDLAWENKMKLAEITGALKK
jgi:hypothetical protein